MATFLTQTQVDNIHQLYVSYFGRAADAAGADYWGDVYLAGLNAGKSDALIISEMAGAFAQSVEFATNYPATLSAAAFVDKIYMNVLGRVADADGKAYWVAQLESGAVAKSDFIVAIVNAVEAQGPTSSDFQYLENRVQVSEYFSENIVESTTQEQIDILAGVTADDATVTDAINEIDGIVNIGETYTLTTGFDDVLGGAGNDSIVGNDSGTATLNPGDVIDGAGGIDTLKVTTLGTAVSLEGVEISNVENMFITSVSDALTDIDVNSVALDSFMLNGYRDGSVDVVNVDSSTDITVNMGSQALSVYNSADVEIWAESDATSVSFVNTVNFGEFGAASGTDDDWQEVSIYHDLLVATEVNADFVVTGAVSDQLTGNDNSFYGEVSVGGADATVNLSYTGSDFSYQNEASWYENWHSVDVYQDGSATVNVDIDLADVGNIALEIDADADDLMTAQVENVANITLDNVYISEGDDEAQITLSGGFAAINIDVVSDSELINFYSYNAAFTYDSQEIALNADGALTVANFDNADDGDNTLTITGAGNVDINYNGSSGSDTINASAATGDNTVILTYSAEAHVTMGVGDDTVGGLALTLNSDSNAFVESYDGGAGIDTFEIDTDALVASQALLNADVTDFSDAIMNFERLSLLGVDVQDIDATTLGFNDITIDGYTTGGSLTVESGADVTVTGAGTTDYAIIVDDADTGTADSLNLTVNGVDGITLAGLTVADVETINLVSSASAPDDTAPGANTVDLIAAGTATLNISGATELVFGVATDLTAVDTVDASGFDAGLSIDLTTSGEAVTVTVGDGDNMIRGSAQADDITAGNGYNQIDGGDGNDTITVGSGSDIMGGLGLDTINLASGTTADDDDWLAYTAVEESQGVTVDVINGFQVDVQATEDVDSDDDVDASDLVNDVIDLSGLVIGTATYAGEAFGYGAVLTTLDGDTLNSQAVLDTSTSTLYVDVDADGALTDADVAIQLTGITDLSDANFNFVV